MGAKPHVDAVDVEGMGADGERTDVIVVLELDEADGTVAACEAEGGAVAALSGGVDGERDGLDDGVVKAVGGEHVEAVAGVERRVVVREGVEVAGGGRKVGAAPSAAPPPSPEKSEKGRDDVAGD